MDVDGRALRRAARGRKAAHGADAKDTDLDASTTSRRSSARSSSVVREDTGREFPTDPLRAARPGRSRPSSPRWFGKRANDYRNSQKIAHDLGTAVNVVTMVFGNMGDDSGTGVAFTRDPNTGEKVLYGEYLINAQGEDVVAGIRTAAPRSASCAVEMPAVYAEFQTIAEQLEQHYRDVQDLEFTIERGTLYMLQTRDREADRRGRREDRGRHGRRGLITERGGASRASSRPRWTSSCAPSSTRPPARPRPSASPRASTPRPAPPSAWPSSTPTWPWSGPARGEKVVLVRVETSPDDFHGMAVAQGILTARGGATSHAAVVARQIGKPCVAGCAELVVDYAHAAPRTRRSGVTFERGRLDQRRRLDRRGLRRRAADGRGPLRGPARAAADPAAGPTRSAGSRSGPTPTSPRRPPRPAATARRASASAAPSTCSARASAWRSCAARSSSRTQATRAKAKIAAGEALDRRRGRRPSPRFDAAMAKLEVLQQGDFEGIFAAMDGLPVVIRLIDPPLHEFLPEPRGPAGQGDQGRGARPAHPRRTRSCSRRSSRCTSRTRCWACAAAAWA